MEWERLVRESEDLLTQDHHEFPRVSRNAEQLHDYAEGLRARTGKFRTLPDQNAATRLLAQQGFDTSRLTQDVAMLEVHPTVEDVFDGDATSVEEYLRQVEEATILTAIQEAQQDTVASFDCYMEDCMARDWTLSKRKLFSFIAPHTGAGGHAAPSPGPGGSLLIGFPSRQGAGGPQASAPGSAMPFASASAGQAVSAKEAAYNEVLLKFNKPTAAGGAAPDLVREFAAACKAKEQELSEAPMSTCWVLLSEVLGEAKSRGVAPQPGARFTEALLQGARKSLERGHATHMRSSIARNRVQAERGPDPDQLRDVQAYILIKVAPLKLGPLDFQQQGGHDTSWLQVYFSLRNGWHDAAKRAADRAQDSTTLRLADVGFRPLLEEWLRNGGRLGDRSAAALVRDVDRLLRNKADLKSQLRQPYLVLLCALLAGYAQALDQLSASLSHLQVASVLASLEDFMWAKLSCVAPQASAASPAASLLSPSSQADCYSLERFHAEINRWPASYYTKNGKEPLLYVTVLLLSLQFQAALQFLWKDETTRAYRVDAVHLAVALHVEGLLRLPTTAAPFDVGHILHSYGRKFVHSGSHVALAYYMLAASVKGNGMQVKGQMLRELLTESGDFGSLLGGGGAAGAGGPLASYIPDVEERRRLFEAVAYECQNAAQPEEAVELYMAADRPRQALALLNGQLSAALPRAVEEQAACAGGVAGSTAARGAVTRLLARGLDARQRVSAATDAAASSSRAAAGSSSTAAAAGPDSGSGGRPDVEAFDQLRVVYDLLLAAAEGRHDMALQKLSELSFIPLDRTRVDACIRLAGQLQACVQDRLTDVLAAAADSIAARAAVASNSQRPLRAQLDALLTFANSVAYRLNKGVYQKLCEASATLSA